MHYSLSNQEMLNELDKYVVGHLEAKKTLITLLGRSRMRYYQKYIKGMDDDFLLTPLKMLMLGMSGTGKSHLVHSLKKIVPFPLVCIDATDLNPTGASGGVKSNKLKELIFEEAKNCMRDYEYLYYSMEGTIDRTVVFVDEIDKLGLEFESTGNWNRHVQSNFLTMFDAKDHFSGISYIFAGAFTGITKPKDIKGSIGFSKSSIEEVRKELIDDLIIKEGLIPELIGRVNSICELDVFTKEQMYDILTSRIIPKKLMDLAAFRIFDKNIPEKRLREIAESSIISGQGIRYLIRAVEKEFINTEFDADVDGIIYNGY